MLTCVECGGALNAPISERRMAEQFKAYLADMDMNLAKRFDEEYVARSDFITENEATCVLSNTPVGVCSHCISMDFIEWLSGKEVAPQILEWALDFFPTPAMDIGRKLQAAKKRRRGFSLSPQLLASEAALQGSINE